MVKNNRIATLERIICGISKVKINSRTYDTLDMYHIEEVVTQN